jgi:rhamnose transport system permease protein
VRAERLARWEAFVVVLMLGTVVLGQSLSSEYLTGDNFQFLALDISEVALMALPVTLVIVAGEIDLSVASVLGLSCALMGELWNAGWPVEMVLPICVVVGAVCGAVNGLLVTRLGLPSLAVTIGTLALYRGLALVILGDVAVADFPEYWTNLGFGNVSGIGIPYTMVLFAVLAVAFGVLLHATPFGRSVFAIGANEEAAYFSGVRVKRVKMTLFVLSGMVAALAGVVYTLHYASARADNGTGLELVVVAAVVLGGVSIFGGRGTVLGVVLALFLLAGIRDALTLGRVSQEWVTIVTGALLIGSVLAPKVARQLNPLVSAARGRPREPRSPRPREEGA